MNPPKIDICIEGYNIEQTDLYIGLLLEKYNQINSQYIKSTETLKLLEEENQTLKNEMLSAIKQISSSLKSFDERLDRIENILKTDDKPVKENKNEVVDSSENQLKSDISVLQNELDSIKVLFSK